MNTTKDWLDLIGSGGRLFGFDVIENPHIPARQQTITLSNDVMVTPKFRREFNQWLKDRFGESLLFYQVPNGIVAHPDVVKIIKLGIKQ